MDQYANDPLNVHRSYECVGRRACSHLQRPESSAECFTLTFHHIIPSRSCTHKHISYKHFDVENIAIRNAALFHQISAV